MNIEDLNEVPENNENQPEVNLPEQPILPETPPVQSWEVNRLDLSPLDQVVSKVKGELEKVIIGQKGAMDLLMAALFTSGHVLLEGVPGIAKTLMAKLLAQAMSVDFARIQFTPDLMPTDVVGTTVFNLKTSDFSFSKGPIFSNIILIDEINRSPAKTQSALFEVMEEYQVTMDGETYPMEFPFFVIATQNPIEQEGTYKLPEAQLDRFIFKINMEYPDLAEEKAILYRFRKDFRNTQKETVQAVCSAEDIKICQGLIEQVHIKDELLDYIATIIHDTRNNGDLFLGASPRASLAIMKTSKAMAAMAGRDFVTPEDIQAVAYPALNHRIILTPEREMEGYTTKEVVSEIIKKIEVPR